MSRVKISFQTTPNPNALKCVVDVDIPVLADQPGPRSYAAGARTGEDRLAARLLEIPGVTNVLISDRWVTINRDPGSDWKTIKKAVETVLGDHLPHPHRHDIPRAG